MTPQSLDKIEADFQRGQSRLSSLTEILASKASELSRRSNYLKLSVIVFGAISATREAAERILPNNPSWTIGVYTLIGILTAIVGGVLASFKYENRAIELKALAVTSDTLMEDMNNQWTKIIYTKQGDDKLHASLGLLEIQDTKIGEILTKAAALTNVAKKLLKQQSNSAIGPTSP